MLADVRFRGCFFLFRPWLLLALRIDNQRLLPKTGVLWRRGQLIVISRGPGRRRRDGVGAGGRGSLGLYGIDKGAWEWIFFGEAFIPSILAEKAGVVFVAAMATAVKTSEIEKAEVKEESVSHLLQGDHVASKGYIQIFVAVSWI